MKRTNAPLIAVILADEDPSFQQAVKSLVAVATEIRNADSKICIFTAGGLSKPLIAQAQDLAQSLQRQHLDAEVLVIETARHASALMNEALTKSKLEKRSLLLLRSDTALLPGALDELLRVASLDHMTGFVCPTPIWQKNHKRLPDFTHKLHSDERCLLIKHTLIADFGPLDERYALPQTTLTDFVLKASRCGYRLVQANHAFVGQLERTPSQHADAGLARTDLAALRKLYPEHEKLVRRQLDSTESIARELALQLPADPQSAYDVLFDFSDFKLSHNGTFEAGKKIIEAAAMAWPPHVRIHVRIDRNAFSFHHLDRNPRLHHCHPDALDRPFSVAIRLGQIFDKDNLQRLFRSAPIVFNFILDTIAHDCSHLSVTFDSKLWSFVCQWSNVVFTNSQYTAHQIKNRFAIGPSCELKALLHSTSVDEYRKKTPEGIPKKYILIIGNGFPHKFLAPTIDFLIASDLQEEFVCVGAKQEKQDSRFRFIESGSIRDEDMDKIYAQAKAMLYPSHYEGFGFPIMNALACNTPIIAREMPAYTEILNSIAGVHQVQLFRTLDEIPALIRRLGTSSLNPTPAPSRKWQDSATDILSMMEKNIEGFSYAHLSERMTWLSYFDQGSKAHSPFQGLHDVVKRIRHLNQQRIQNRRAAKSLRLSKKI